jgi:hypothetical protein
MWKDDGFLHDRLYCFAEQRGTDTNPQSTYRQILG